MPEHRTFRLAVRPKHEPITFDFESVEGEPSPTWHGDIDAVPGSLIVGVVTPDDVWTFFRFLLGDEYAAFREWVDDPGRHVEAQNFADVVNWVIELRAGVPTRQPSNS